MRTQVAGALLLAAFMLSVGTARGQQAQDQDDKAELKKAKEALEKARAEIAALQAQLKDAERKNAELAKQFTEEKKKVESEKAALKLQVVTLADELQKAKKANLELAAAQAVQQAEAKRRQAEAEKLQAVLAAERKRNLDLLQQNADLKGKLVAAQIEARSFRDRNERLTQRLKEMEKVNPGGKIDRNPPKKEVEGLIKTVEEKAGLVTIDVGSDAGLAKGHTLEVFRLKPQPKYLGTLRIVDVTKKTAVGQSVGRLSEPLKVGDRVASGLKIGD
jgi:hypothetical protein